jgi:hypothetical protein
MIVTRLQNVGRTRALAWATTMAGALVVATALAFFAPADFGLGYETFALAMVAWMVGPLATWNPRPRLTRAAVTADGVRVGKRLLHADDVRGVSVAPADHGASVAVTTDRDTLLLEVQSIDEAERIAAALGLGAPSRRRGAITLDVPARWPMLATRILAVVGPACAALYYGAATAAIPGGKMVWGATALLLAIAQTALFVFGPRARTRVALGTSVITVGDREADLSAVTVRREADGVTIESPAGALTMPRAWPAGEHLALHAQPAIAPSEAEDAASSDAPPPSVDEPRSRIGVRRGESVAAWLARLDGWARGEGAYRADMPTEEELRAAVRDDGSPLDVRLGAQRLLQKHHRGPQNIRFRIEVEDPDVAQRLEAMCVEEAAEAEARLSHLGPMFVAKIPDATRPAGSRRSARSHGGHGGHGGRG